MSDKDGQRGIEEGLEEGGIEIYYGENPVERVNNISDEFKQSV